MLQFITNTNCHRSPKDQIIEAIDGGCRWIQIRMKDASDQEIKDLFFSIRDKAKETMTTVIINDCVELAKELGPEGVAGVHLGRKDMSPYDARLKMGPQAIIGVTANTFEEIDEVRKLDIDYIGIGPFAETKTKENLAPVLGLEGIAAIMSKVKENNIEIPCVAVGGIKLEDVKSLLAAGVNGIAVSGAIAAAENEVETVKSFISELPMNE